MKNWDIPSMIIETRKRIIPEMAIPRRPCIPTTEIWRLISQATGKVGLNHRSSKVSEYGHSGHGRKENLHVYQRNDYE